jgi:hypothetical protein
VNTLPLRLSNMFNVPKLATPVGRKARRLVKDAFVPIASVNIEINARDLSLNQQIHEHRSHPEHGPRVLRRSPSGGEWTPLSHRAAEGRG